MIDPSLQNQIKIFPIEKLHLGPQTNSMCVYNTMMNFHEITNGIDVDEAFVTGRMGISFDAAVMHNVLTVACKTAQKYNEEIMVEVEEYFVDFTIGPDGFQSFLDVSPSTSNSTNNNDVLKCKTDFEKNLAKSIPEYELHLAFDIPKDSMNCEHMPISLEDLMIECSKYGMNNGGWFIFQDSNIWKYRSNEFISDISDEEIRTKLRKQANDVCNIMQDCSYTVDVMGSIEVVHGIWSFP